MAMKQFNVWKCPECETEIFLQFKNTGLPHCPGNGSSGQHDRPVPMEVAHVTRFYTDEGHDIRLTRS